MSILLEKISGMEQRINSHENLSVNTGVNMQTHHSISSNNSTTDDLLLQEESSSTSEEVTSKELLGTTDLPQWIVQVFQTFQLQAKR